MIDEVRYISVFGRVHREWIFRVKVVEIEEIGDSGAVVLFAAFFSLSVTDHLRKDENARARVKGGATTTAE